MLESRFQANLIRELKERFVGCVVLKNDANYIQGFPDLLILFHGYWAALECKASADAPLRPNQMYYIDTLDDMSYAKVVYPENKDYILESLTRFFNE